MTREKSLPRLVVLPRSFRPERSECHWSAHYLLTLLVPHFFHTTEVEREVSRTNSSCVVYTQERCRRREICWGLQLTQHADIFQSEACIPGWQTLPPVNRNRTVNYILGWGLLCRPHAPHAACLGLLTDNSMTQVLPGVLQKCHF